MVILVPGLLAYVFGYLAFRSRIKGVYFSILTQALTYGAALLFFRNELLMGGNNGFTDFRTLLGFSLREDSTKRGLYIATAVLLVAVVAFCKWLTNSRFGLIQRAIRDSENRVLFSGYATANFKLFIFVISAIIASFAGALFVPQVGIINPSEMETGKSLEAVVWVALGGRGTIVGPVVGAISVNAIKSWASSGATADFWPMMLGGAFVLVVLFMPKGIVGIPSQIAGIITAIRRKRAAGSLTDTAASPSQATDP
jgi:urea transport system permease protein